MAFITVPQEMKGVYIPEIQLLYGELYSRYCLSYGNKEFRDDQGVFIYYSIESTQKVLSCKREKAEKMHKRMIEAGLIKRCKTSKGYKIYIVQFFEDCPEVPKRYTKQTLEESPNAGTYAEELMRVYDKLEIACLCANKPMRALEYHEIAAIVAEVNISNRPYYQIQGDRRTNEDVRYHLSQLTSEHVEHVVDMLHKSDAEIKNIKAYTISCLYSISTSFHTQITNEVIADQGGRRRTL